MQVDTFQRFARDLPIAVLQTARDGHFIYANRLWLELSGISAEAAAGRGWLETIDIADRDRVQREWFDAAHPIQFVTGWRTTGGVLVRTSIGLLWNDDGLVTGYAAAAVSLGPRYDSGLARAASSGERPAVTSGDGRGRTVVSSR